MCFVRKLILLFFLSGVQIYAQSPEYFTTPQHVGGQIAHIQNYKFPEHTFSFRAPPNWSNLSEGGIIQFRHRTLNAFIEIKYHRLNQPFADEKSALEFYTSKVKELPEPNFVKDARARDIDLLTTFPQTYLLSINEKEPPIKMVTFLFYAPNLYEITLEARGPLKGDLRTDYGDLCKSIAFESTEGQTKSPAAISGQSTSPIDSAKTSTTP